MSTNAKLIIDWSDKTCTILDCTWRQNGEIDEGEALALHMYQTIQANPSVTLVAANVFFDQDLTVYQEIEFNTKKMTVSTKPWPAAERSKKYAAKHP